MWEHCTFGERGYQSGNVKGLYSCEALSETGVSKDNTY